MAPRYWVGGTATWDATAGTKWSDTDGGAGGATVPTAADDVYFTASSSGTCTISTSRVAKSITCTGFTGTLAGSSAITVSGNLTLSSGMTVTYSGAFTMAATATVVSAGKTINLTVNAPSATVTLGDALTASTLTLTAGTLNTGNYTVTASTFTGSGTSTRSLVLGSSTVNVTATWAFSTTTSLTFSPGTSQLNITGSAPTFDGGGLNYNNVAFTSTTLAGTTITGANVFNDLLFTGRSTASMATVTLSANQTVNGSFTVTAGTNAACRIWVRSSITGTVRTLTCNAVGGLTDVDFSDTTFAGNCVSGGNVTGTRLGNCGGNTGISFPAAKTVYWASTLGANWNSNSWSDGVNNTPDLVWFPLAQDTAVISASKPNSGEFITLSLNYNLGTVDFSARTTASGQTVTVPMNNNQVYGDWINGTGVTLSTAATLEFRSRGAQTITSAGRTWPSSLTIACVTGSVTLADAYTSTRSGSGVITLTSGTFDAAGYNVTLSAGGFNSSATATRTLALGAGTWTIGATGTSAWQCFTSTGLTVTGSATISMTDATSKTFEGGSVAYTNVTLNQGGSGPLTISGNNTFSDISNTYKNTGATALRLAGNQTVTTFSARGEAARILSIYSSIQTTTRTITIVGGGGVNIDYVNVQDLTGLPSPAIDGTTPYVWYVGANSVNNLRNNGLLFAAGGSGATKAYRITNTATTSWTVPADWNSASNAVYLFGGGGGGASGIVSGNNRAAGGGGGGGGYASVTNFTATPGATITVAVGIGGSGAASGAGTGSAGGDTSWNAGAVVAGGGQPGMSSTTPTSAGGAGGTGSFAGGTGGAGAFGTAASTGYGGGGGGGAGGPLGVGGNGGAGFGSTTQASISGGGGGGNGGGSAGVDGASANGGNGGNNASGTGGSTTDGISGSFGGGGSGGTTTAGGTGGAGIDLLNTLGSGGGTGGAGVAATRTGGLHGGGGAGGAVTTAGSASSGSSGGAGAIFIAYTPGSAPAPSVNGNFLFMMFG